MSRWTSATAWALTGLKHDVHGLALAQRAARRDERVEPDALELLHHEVGFARVELAHVVHAGAVLAPERRGGSGLVEEAPDGLLIVLQVRANELDRDGGAERDVSGRANDAHPALTDDRAYPVAITDDLPRDDRDG
jgi:hypothetical protein